MAEGGVPSSLTHAAIPPTALWGLDCHFSCCSRLYICHIQALTPHHSHPGVVIYGNHPLYKVDVMGVVVRKEEKQKLFLYAVDDGTGVINCCIWKQLYTSHGRCEERGGTLSGLGPDLRSKLTALRSERDTEVTTYDLGNLLHVRGCLKVFHHTVEIVAFYHSRVDNPNRQVMRMLELPSLYRQCYDKPFIAPCHIEQQMTVREGQASRREQGPAVSEQPPWQSEQDLPRFSRKQGLPYHRLQTVNEELKVQIHRVLSTLKAAEFCLSDVLMDTAVAALATSMDQKEEGRGAVREVLRELEEVTGTVCLRHQTSLPYENLERLCPLEGQVLSILRTLCSRPKYRDQGCHVQQIHSEVHRSVQYSSLGWAALLHVLHRLETSSDVIRVTQHCYLPV